MRKTLINKLATFGMAAALTLGSCSKPDSPSTPNPPNPPTPIENKAPTARGNVDKNYGEINDTFIFNAYDSSDPEGKPMTYSVDVDGDGTYDTAYISTNTNTNYIYTNGGNMNPKIQVKDDKGLTSTYSLGKVGILDPANNPISIDFQVPKYIVAGEEIKATVEATDVNNKPLVYSIDWGVNQGNIVDSNNKQHSKTYSENDVGKKTLEGIAMNNYQVQNETTKEVEIGSPIPSYVTVTDAIDGKNYKVNMMDDGNFWIVQNFAGKIGEADWYKSDSLNHSVFGRYYNASEIDQIGDRIMITSNGTEHVFKVASEEEWGQLRDSNGGRSVAGGVLKYKEFSNGGNIGATNESRFSGMLGGVYDTPVNFDRLGDLGVYMTSDDNELGTKKAYLLSKDDTKIQLLNNNPNGLRGSVRLIKNNSLNN